ncbi:uncharacterized protein LAJ45_01075 [Morchella importuna]|uniref:uncharacterized protein n=1 Tax=Morchella importuna TaxID=1174673 RepID=UPI001E8ED544|nr:uncharacterized protein LAJ45_01075 [Morchella importuna]KAH8154547.1 hypothetical protein LAJ45_01075 [Morchella importuna]
MAPKRPLYSQGTYEASVESREDPPRRSRALRSRSPGQPMLIDVGDTPPRPSDQQARNRRVDRRAEAPEERNSNFVDLEEANVRGRRQSRNMSPPAREPRDANQEYSDFNHLREYRERDPNPWRVNSNEERHGRQTTPYPTHNTRTLADHVVRSYPDWTKQSDIEKEYTAVDKMIELFRNDQRAQQPTLNDRSGTTSMSRQRYEGRLDTWLNPPPNMSSLIEANARMRDQAELQRSRRDPVGNNLPLPRERAEKMISADMQNPPPDLARRSRHTGRSARPLTPPRAGPSNYRSQPPDLRNFVGTGSPPVARSENPGGGRVLIEPNMEYFLRHGNSPVAAHQPQAQRPAPKRNEEFRNVPTAPRSVRPFTFDPQRTYGQSRPPSPRAQATVEVAPFTFPAPRRLQQGSRDLPDQRIRPSPVFDCDEGELPDSQDA